MLSLGLIATNYVVMSCVMLRVLLLVESSVILDHTHNQADEHLDHVDFLKVFVQHVDYELNQEKGEWRNLITLVSDDGCQSRDCSEGNQHTVPSENLSITEKLYPNVKFGKVL